MPITSHIIQDQNTKTDTITIYKGKRTIDRIIYNHAQDTIWLSSSRPINLCHDDLNELFNHYIAFNFDTIVKERLGTNNLYNMQRCRRNELELFMARNELPIFNANVTIKNTSAINGRRDGIEMSLSEWRYVSMLLKQFQETVKKFKELYV